LIFKINRVKELVEYAVNNYTKVIPTGKINTTGCAQNAFMDPNDIMASYDRYQESINIDTMSSVTLAQYTKLPQLRKAYLSLSSENKLKLREYD
jgi:hypothetical protein